MTSLKEAMLNVKHVCGIYRIEENRINLEGTVDKFIRKFEEHMQREYDVLGDTAEVGAGFITATKTAVNFLKGEVKTQ